MSGLNQSVIGLIAALSGNAFSVKHINGNLGKSRNALHDKVDKQLNNLGDMFGAYFD
jgi:hypothetical protein